MRLGEPIRKIEETEKLDRVTAPVKRLVDRVFPEGRVRDTLHGVQLGHPAHPLLVQIPIGTWTSAVLIDLFAGDGPGARRSAHLLVNTGVLSAVPAIWAGFVDWSRQHERQQRVGVVHATVNYTGLLLFGLSSLARTRKRHAWGTALGVAGLGMVSVGGLLGAHISYYRASGANRADYLVDRLPSDWHGIGRITDFPEAEPTRVDVGDVPLAVVRAGQEVHALVGVCGHLGGPLEQGEWDGECLRCPWHGSAFRAADGVVANGPATAAQPMPEVAVRDGMVSVRRPPEGHRAPLLAERREAARLPRPRQEEAGVPEETARGASGRSAR